MRIFNALTLLSCSALFPLLTVAQEATPAASEPKAGVPGILRNIWETAVNGGRPIDIEARAKDDEAAGMERLTDANYQDVFAAAKPEEVFVVVIHSKPADLVSTGYLEMHTNASKLLQENEAPTVANTFRFARLDWMTDWVLTSRWLITKPPYIAFVSDNGHTLRFVSPPRLNAEGSTLYEALAKGYWSNLPPWKGSFAPGGDNAYLVEYYITAQKYFTKYSAMAPKWVWLAVPLLSTMVGQSIMERLHRRDDQAQREYNAARAREKQTEPKSQ